MADPVHPEKRRSLEDLEGAPDPRHAEAAPTRQPKAAGLPVPVEREVSDRDAQELREYAIFGKSLEAMASELVTGFQGDRQLRRPLALYVCGVTGIWLLAVIGIILAAGLGMLTVPSSVQLALLGSATLAIIGLLATVLTYYFTNRDLTREFFTEILKQIRQR